MKMAKKVKLSQPIKSTRLNLRPVGVTILAILGYIGAVFSLIAGIVMIFGSAAIASMLSQTPISTIISALGASAFIMLGIFFIIASIIDYFIARGLWIGKNWARIVVLVFSALGFLSALTSLNIASLVIDGVIIWYLGFNKPAVNYFK